jgi:hypothetical protein
MDSHARAGTKGQLGALDPNIKTDTSRYKSTASVGASNHSLISSAMVVWDLHNKFSFLPKGQMSYIPDPRGTNVEHRVRSENTQRSHC